MIPACLWFLAKNKTNGKFRNRSNEILFIDARNLGVMVNRKNRELSEKDIKTISDTYHNWRNVKGNYKDIQGFCKSASMAEVAENNYVLMPGRYVGTEDEIEDPLSFDEKMKSLTETLNKQFIETEQLHKAIRQNLKSIGYEF